MRALIVLSQMVGLLLLATHASAQTLRPELNLLYTEVGTQTTAIELSGIAASTNESLYTISDKKTDHFIYQIIPTTKPTAEHAGRISLTPVIDLSELDGYETYMQELKSNHTVDKKDRRLDIEGIAICDDTIYLINERVREVLEIKDRKTLRRLPIDWSPALPGLRAGGANAGLEGITIDCAKKQLYIAKEREPRILMRFDLQDNKLTVLPDITPSDRIGQKVIHPFTGQGLYEIAADCSDLSFSGGFLYALERNSFEIAKIDPQTMQVLSRVSYRDSERLLFDSGEPFGSAEALLIKADSIIVGYDNNDAPLSFTAAKRFGVSPDSEGRNTHEVIMHFARPVGF